jgi:hypothetical protein
MNLAIHCFAADSTSRYDDSNCRVNTGIRPMRQVSGLPAAYGNSSCNGTSGEFYKYVPHMEEKL